MEESRDAKIYREIRDRVTREAEAEFVGYDGVNPSTLAVGRGDYRDILKAFCYDVGISNENVMIEAISHINRLDNSYECRYVYNMVKHKMTEADFRKILKKYRGYVDEFRKRYGLLMKEFNAMYPEPQPAKQLEF